MATAEHNAQGPVVDLRCALYSVHANGQRGREELDILAWFRTHRRGSILPIGRASRAGFALVGPEQTRCRASRQHAKLHLEVRTASRLETGNRRSLSC